MTDLSVEHLGSIIVLTDMGRWTGWTKARRDGVLLPLLLLCVLLLYKLDIEL